MSRTTPLHDLHVELSAKIVDFAGWQMPVSYPTGLMAEHAACRNGAALFDVSHMGQVELRGDAPAAALEGLVPANLTNLAEGRARYSFFTNAEGGILDDLIISNAGDHLYVVVNAGCADQDLAHMRAELGGVEVLHRSDLALLALQGPAAERILEALVPGVAALAFMQTAIFDPGDGKIRVSRLGYTGEDGFEVSLPADAADGFARKLISAGAVPAGLGARDSLRMEAGLCLYGQDIDTTTTPIEANLTWAIQKRRREEGGYPGHDRITREIADGPARRLVGILPDGRAPARAGTAIADPDGRIIGQVTSGGFSPSLGRPISMGYVQTALAAPDTPVSLIVRGKPLPARTAALPFVPHSYKR